MDLSLDAYDGRNNSDNGRELVSLWTFFVASKK